MDSNPQLKSPRMWTSQLLKATGRRPLISTTEHVLCSKLTLPLGRPVCWGDGERERMKRRHAYYASGGSPLSPLVLYRVHVLTSGRPFVGAISTTRCAFVDRATSVGGARRKSMSRINKKLNVRNSRRLYIAGTGDDYPFWWRWETVLQDSTVWGVIWGHRSRRGEMNREVSWINWGFDSHICCGSLTPLSRAGKYSINNYVHAPWVAHFITTWQICVGQ